MLKFEKKSVAKRLNRANNEYEVKIKVIMDDSSVTVVTRLLDGQLRNRGSILRQGQNILPSVKRPDRFWGRLGTLVLSIRTKATTV